MKKIGLLFLFIAAMLAFVGCPNNTTDDEQKTLPNSGSTQSNGTKISGLQANITVNAYMGDTQYNIQLNAEKGTFKATSLQPMIKPRPNQIIGRGDTDEEYDTITGSFVCNKTAAGDDLYWYAHNSAICLKPDTVTDSANTEKSCYKIIADLTKTSGINGTGTDNTVDVTNKYCTKNITSAEFTSAETAAKTAWDHSNDATSVTFTEEQKTCLKAADDILKTCTKKGVSSLTQTFDADGNTNKDYTVGFSFNLDDTTCDVFIDKDKVAISTDESTDFSRSTPTWLMDAVKTVITSGASPDDIKNCSELKDCTALQTVITELASSVGSANDDVVYTEHGKDDYKAIPCPWSEDELAKMKVFTEHYKDEVGAFVHPSKYIEKFSNDDAFEKNADGKRTTEEVTYIMGYGKITEMLDEHRYNFGDEHVFGIKITVDLDGINALLPLNEWTNPSVIYDYFTFSKADAVANASEPLTWHKNADNSYEPIYSYEETPQWILDMITTYTSKEHSDYDRQFNIGGTGCPLSYIGDVWIDGICYEYLYGPNANTGYDNMEFIFDVYERDLTTDTYPETPKQMTLREIRALVDAGDYAAYADDVTDDWTATSMANYWDEYENESKDADGNTRDSNNWKKAYTVTFYGQRPIYIKKIVYNVVYQQKNGNTFTNTGRVDKLTLSEIRQLMATWKNAGCKLFMWNDGTSQWTGEYENGNWQIYTSTGETRWSSPTNNTVYFLQTDSN